MWNDLSHVTETCGTPQHRTFFPYLPFLLLVWHIWPISGSYQVILTRASILRSESTLKTSKLRTFQVLCVLFLPQQNLLIGCPGLARLPNNISLRWESDGLASWNSEQQEKRQTEAQKETVAQRSDYSIWSIHVWQFHLKQTQKTVVLF